MNGLPYYKAYPRDFIEGTIGMRFELKAAYRLVLDLIYMQGGALPDDARYVSGLLGCTIRKWKSLRDELISIRKIEVNGEFLTNKRAVIELETLTKLQDKQRENRSRPNKNKDLESPPFDHTEPDTDKEREANASLKKKPTKRASRIPDDWQPDYAEAERLGLSRQQSEREADRFRDYWRGASGQNATKLDWLATWRNWCRTAAERLPRTNSQAQGPPSHESALQRATRIARETLENEPAQSSDNVIDITPVQRLSGVSERP